MVPVTELGIDGAVVDDREAVVRAVRVEGQQVDAVDDAGEVGVEKLPQRLQWPLARVLYAVSIGHQHGVPFVPEGG